MYTVENTSSHEPYITITGGDVLKQTDRGITRSPGLDPKIT